jgi:hypothetical protein
MNVDLEPLPFCRLVPSALFAIISPPVVIAAAFGTLALMRGAEGRRHRRHNQTRTSIATTHENARSEFLPPGAFLHCA